MEKFVIILTIFLSGMSGYTIVCFIHSLISYYKLKDNKYMKESIKYLLMTILCIALYALLINIKESILLLKIILFN